MQTHANAIRVSLESLVACVPLHVCWEEFYKEGECFQKRLKLSCFFFPAMGTEAGSREGEEWA